MADNPVHAYDQDNPLPSTIVGSTTPADDFTKPMIIDGWRYYWDELRLGWYPVPGGKVDEDGGRGSSSSWSGQYVNDALSAASQAISAFMTGQSLADARKLASAEQFQQLAAWALPAGMLPPGFEEGGAMHQAAAMMGRDYTPPPNERRQVDPAALEQPGQVPQEIMDAIDRMLGAADQGQVVVTGGSSSG